VDPPRRADGTVDFDAWGARLRAKGIQGDLATRLAEARAGAAESVAEIRVAERYRDAGYVVELVRPDTIHPGRHPDLHLRGPDGSALRGEVKAREPGKPVTRNSLNARIDEAYDQVKHSAEGNGDIVIDASEAGPGGLDQASVESFLKGKMSGSRTSPVGRLRQVDYLEVTYRAGGVLKRSFMVRTGDGDVNGPFTEILK